MVDVVVAVCARSGSPTLDRCVADLRVAGATPVVLMAAPGRGLADARNAALEAARSSDVLALVEDDITVAEDWLGALGQAWSQAPERCGVIGGPVGARILGERPRWLTDAQLGVLGVASSGSTFHGANVSFRVEALLGIGGFWPARGRTDTRDWFSEEHFAQHQLAEAGWGRRVEPAMRADRLIDAAGLRRRDLLGRRARYGARSTVVGGPRGRAAAARAAAVSGAGTMAALVKGNRVLGMERAARASENAGALAGGALARRDLRPDRPETPFRHSIPMAPRRARRALPRRRGPIALVYHRVDDAFGAGVTPERFAEQMDAVRAHGTPLAMSALARDRAPRDAIAVTFDDGYAETLLTHVLPTLERMGVPATVFVATAHVSEGRGFWWDELERLLRIGAPGPLRLTLDGETRAWACGNAGVLPHLIAWLQPQVPEAITTVMEQLREWSGSAADLPGAERPLTLAELKRLAASPLVEIGAHTRTHPNLRHAGTERALAELEGSRADLTAWLGTTPAGLAYPFGVPGADLDAATRRATARAGFDYAVINQAGALGPRTDRYALPRAAPPEAAGAAFTDLLTGRG